MPYKEIISEDILDGWLKQLVGMVNRFQYTTEDALCVQCLVSLYEYLQAYSEFVLQGRRTITGVKVVVKSIKNLVGRDNEALNALINGFFSLRNDASHTFITKDVALDYKKFLADDRLISLLKVLGVDGSLIKCLERNRGILSNSISLQYKDYCLKECSHLLLNLKLSLEEVVSLLNKKYDTSTINACIVEVLHNQCVV